LFSIININEFNKKYEGKINKLDQSIFLLTEDFIPNYIRYLRNPNNIEYTEETNYTLGSINKINSDAFVYMNEMHNEIDKESVITANLTNKMERLKKENSFDERENKIIEKTIINS